MPVSNNQTLSIKVSGVKHAIKKMEKVMFNVGRKGAVKALNVAMTIAQKDMRKRTPKSKVPPRDGKGRPRKHLKEIIEKKQKSYRKSKVSIVIVGASVRPEKGFHAHLIEHGTKEHTTPISDPTKTAAGILIKSRIEMFDAVRRLFNNPVVRHKGKPALRHPGIKAQDIVTRTYNSTKTKVANKFNSVLNAKIKQEINKLARKQMKKGFVA